MNKIAKKHLKSLPDEIVLAGIGLSGYFYLNGEPLTLTKDNDWRYSPGSGNVTTSILVHFIPCPQVFPCFDLFKEVLVDQLPRNSFQATLKFKEFMLTLFGFAEPAKLETFLEYEPINIIPVIAGTHYSTYREEVDTPDEETSKKALEDFYGDTE